MIVDLIAYTQRVVPTSDKNPLDIVEEGCEYLLRFFND